MTRFPIAALLATAVGFTPALAQPPTVGRPPDPSKVYGPSWLAFTRPGPSGRPEKLDKPVTVGIVGRSGNELAVEVRFWGDVAELKKGSQYELRYQLRVHTKRGETGPLLGDAAHPDGVAYTVFAATPGDDWVGLEGVVDVTRKDLSATTNLPKPPKSKAVHTVLIRVEPQLYDASAGKYLTAGKTEAVVVVARVWSNGKVWEVLSLSEWLAGNVGDSADDTLALLATLDDYDPTASGVEVGVMKVLELSDLNSATKAKFIAALPGDRMNWKQNFNLKRLLQQFADGKDETLKSAAKKKLGEAK